MVAEEEKRHPLPSVVTWRPGVSKNWSKSLGFSYPWPSLVLTDMPPVKRWVLGTAGTLAGTNPWMWTFGEEFSHFLIYKVRYYTQWVILNLPLVSGKRTSYNLQMPRLHEIWFQLVRCRAQVQQLLEYQLIWICRPWWSPSAQPRLHITTTWEIRKDPSAQGTLPANEIRILRGETQQSVLCFGFCHFF